MDLSKKRVEYLVLETGLGGMLDCTNVFTHPLLTIITSISLEHTEYLGDTIEKIAAEKAGSSSVEYRYSMMPAMRKQIR